MRHTSGISEVFILLNNSDHMLGFVTPGHKKYSLPFGRLYFLYADVTKTSVRTLLFNRIKTSEIPEVYLMVHSPDDG